MKVVIVGMIYKSLDYLEFMLNEIDGSGVSGYNLDYLIIANDATNEVIEYLQEEDVKHLIYKDPNPNDYYINRIYRAWNFGGFNANGDIIVFVNSDMAFGDFWLEYLLEQLTPDTIPTSRLIESGKMPSGKHALSQNFGRTPQEFNYNRDTFYNFADILVETTPEPVADGGLFMPVAFYKKDFVESGGYPPGNIYIGGPGRVDTPFLMSGDAFFFYENHIMRQKKHVTVMKSIVYHFQQGEMDE